MVGMATMFPRLLTQTITLHLRGGGAEDDHGNTEALESDLEVPGYTSNQVPTEEGAVVGAELRLFLSPGSPLTGWDACSVEGLKYEVIGQPWSVIHARQGLEHHVEARIRRADT